jgi:DNA-binding response OmpR family regulator
MITVLVIEDDAAIQLGLKIALEEENYNIITFEDGHKGFNEAKRLKPDIILLDLMLPNKNGLDICRDLRREGFKMPILMLTSKKEEIDKVLGFETGADDYVTKPFSIVELKMRIKALLRRSSPDPSDINNCEFDDIKIDFKKLEAIKKEKTIQLSAKEFQILKFFISKEGEVITRDALLDNVWGYESFPSTRTVDNFILQIRKKIEDDPSNPKHLITIHTVGYKFIK